MTPPLAGRTALVTAGTAGIGFQTAKLLAQHGATVVVTGRDPDRGARAVSTLTAAAGHDRVEFVAVDHLTAAANAHLATLMTSRPDRLDVLVNNVGGIFATRTLNQDGNELSLAVNFLAPYVLTETLLPALIDRPADAGPARVVNVVSSSFKMAKGDPFDDIQSQRWTNGLNAHGRAKLLCLLWTMALARATPADELTVTAVNPGTAWTPMTQSLTPEIVPAWRHIFPIVQFFQRRADPARAASHCADLVLAEPGAVAGRYFDGRKPQDLPRKHADPALAERARALGATLRDAALGAA